MSVASLLYRVSFDYPYINSGPVVHIETWIVQDIYEPDGLVLSHDDFTYGYPKSDLDLFYGTTRKEAVEKMITRLSTVDNVEEQLVELNNWLRDFG